MKKYEVLFIIDGTIAEDAIKSTVKKVEDLLAKSGASNVSIEEWGMKKLAYAINYKDNGYYVLVNFEAESIVPNEIKHQLNLNEQVLRSMIITKEV